MNEMTIFENPEFGSVRTTVIDDEPWFVGKDVAVTLGYAEPRSAISKKIDDEDRGVAKIATPSGTQEMTIINESGLYALIFGSKLSKAKKFKRWVTSEVLPAIRKNGTYTMVQAHSILTKDDYLKAALIVSRCKNERLPYVLNFLESAGLNIPKVQEVQYITNYNTADDTVIDFLECNEDIQIENVPTNIVYTQYRSYCDENNLTELCSGEFSKQVKRILNMSIISKRIRGKTYRLFVKN